MPANEPETCAECLPAFGHHWQTVILCARHRAVGTLAKALQGVLGILNEHAEGRCRWPARHQAAYEAGSVALREAGASE